MIKSGSIGTRYTRSVNLTLLDKVRLMNWPLLVGVMLLCAISVIMLYSVGYINCSPLEPCSVKYGSWDPFAIKQLIRIILGFGVMFFVAMINIKYWLKYAYWFYAGVLLMLIIVLAIGHVGMGAQRWVNIGGFVFQPSELMKVAIVLALARYFAWLNLNELRSLSVLMVPLALILIPTGLVLKQPDLGTALIFVMLGTTMLFVGGVPTKRFTTVGVVVLLALPIVWQFGLHDYQKRRVMTFMNPSQDKSGASYHITQSKIALGSGGFSGKGFLKGSQSHLNFLPEKQTDFIFTMYAEEFGFLGSVGLLFIYIVVIMSGFFIVMGCRSRFGSLLGIGVMTNFFLYLFINMAMVMGLIPVVGVPLPLVSYGGSSILTLLFSIGLMQNIYIHKDMLISGNID